MTTDLAELHILLSETHAAYEAFGEYYDLMYAAQGRKSGTYRPEVASAFADLMQSKGCLEVLDCACGTGDPIIGVALQGKIKITASDRSDRMLSRCILNGYEEGLLECQDATVPASGSNLEIVKSCWQDLPASFDRNRFDMVVCVGHGFFHLISRENMVSALRSMAEVVKPGGYVVFDVKRWDENVDLHQEVGIEPVSWRKWLQAKDSRLMFINSTHYYDDQRGVDGVIQLKNFYVLEETSNEVQVKAHSRFWGAPFRGSTALAIARDAGLSEIQEVDFNGMPDYMTRYTTIIGKK